MLPAQNTEEYKIREAYALKVANQIESSEVYKRRIELENHKKKQCQNMTFIHDQENEYLNVILLSGS